MPMTMEDMNRMNRNWGNEGMGRRMSIDLRDHKHLITPPRRAKIRRKSWRAGETLDQGNTGRCVIFSTTGLLLAQPVVNSLSVDDHVMTERYHLVQGLDEWDDTPPEDGTSVRAAMKFWQGQGYFSGYSWSFDYLSSAMWILTRSPMVWGTVWPVSFFEPETYRHEAWLSFDPDKGEAGGHAYLVPQVDLDKACPDGTVGAVRILNSWGTNWADGGMAWMPFSAAKSLISNGGEAVCPREVVKKKLEERPEDVVE